MKSPESTCRVDPPIPSPGVEGIAVIGMKIAMAPPTSEPMMKPATIQSVSA